MKALLNAIAGLREQKIKEIFDEYDLVDQAEPTSRLLPDVYNDGEEWKEKVKLSDGTIVYVYYYFDEAEVAEAGRANPDNPPEEYPWDAEHVLRITDDEEVDLVESWM